MLTAPSVLASASSFWVRSEPVRLEYFAKGPALALPPLLGACVVGEVPQPASMSAAVARTMRRPRLFIERLPELFGGVISARVPVPFGGELAPPRTPPRAPVPWGPWSCQVPGLGSAAHRCGVGVGDGLDRSLLLGRGHQPQRVLERELHGVALDLVQAHGAQQASVLDGQVARGVVAVEVEVLVPGPARRRQQHALGPVDAGDRVVVVVDQREAGALDDVEVRLGGVAVAGGPAARLQLGDVGGEDLVAGQVEPQAPVVAPGPLRHLHVPEVVRDDQALDRWVLAVELVPCGDLRRRPVPLLVGEHTELVILAHHCLLACGRRSEGRGAGRFQIVRQLLTESLLLSLIGGALGLLWAVWGIRALISFVPERTRLEMPYLSSVHADMTTLFFLLVLIVLTGVAFGIGPALQVSKSECADTLREE